MREHNFFLKTSESFNSPSHNWVSALHSFPRYKGLKESEAEEFYELAMKQIFQEGADFDAVKANLLKAIELKPDYVDAYTALGDVSCYSGEKPGKARHWYTHALDIESDNANALLGLVHVMIATGELSQAERAKAKLEKLHPRFMKYTKVERREAGAGPCLMVYYSRRRNSQISKCIGDGYYQAGQFEKAIKCYRTVTTLDSTDIETRLALGLARYRCHKYDDAALVYRKMVSNSESLLFSSSLNYRVWNCDDWISRFGEHPMLSDVGSISGPIRSAWNNLGLVYMAQSRLKEAGEAFKQVENSGAAENNSGVLLWKQGKVEAAKQVLHQSSYFESKFNLAQILESEKIWQKASDCWKSYLDGCTEYYVGAIAGLYTDSLNPEWKKFAEDGLDRCKQKI